MSTLAPRTKSAFAEQHWGLIAVLVSIASLGVYNLHSSAAAKNPDLYLTQMGLLIAGILLVAGLSFFDYRISESLAYPFFIAVCILLVAVLVQGKSAGGAQRWLSLGPLTFQPSELGKLATILCLSKYFSSRIQARGYTMRDLFRPLNVSRPFALGALIVWFWQKPWMADPIGELARLVALKAGKLPPEVGNEYWFRFLVLGSLVGATLFAVLFVVQWERQQRLLSPWPPGRLRTMVAIVAALFLAGLAASIWSWDEGWMRDPVGTALLALYHAAQAGGARAVLQESLLLRASLALFASGYFALALWRSRHDGGPVVDKWVAPIDLLLLPTVLVLVEPDLGTAGIVALIGFTIILVAGVRMRSLMMMVVVGTLASGVGWFGVLKDYQKRRVLTFIDPEEDAQGAGWNAVQSMIAVGSGQWLGKGHREGTQTKLKFLPEQHTDFAFGVWAEEQGFVGCMLLLGLYFALIAFGITIAAEARELYGALLASGVVALIMWQTLINISMVIGAFPVVGMTLPLFSYGGSSLLTVVVGVALLLNVYAHRRTY